MIYKVSVIGVFVLTVLFSSQTFAKNGDDVNFAANIEDSEVSLVLKGVGYKRFFFRKVFVAGFYMEDNVSSEMAQSDVSKRIEVEYFVKIPGEKLSNYTEDLMQENLNEEEYDLIEEEMLLMRDYFVDLKPGDRYALTYIPKVGTKFEHNGNVIGIIEGQEFAKGLFATWIGDNPMDKKIKDQILGLVSLTLKDRPLAFQL